MTVQQLGERLMGLPGDARVVIYNESEDLSRTLYVKRVRIDSGVVTIYVDDLETLEHSRDEGVS